MLAEQIGRAIQAARTRVGLSISELAATTSLDPDALSSLEHGQRLLSTAKLDRIAQALGIDAVALYDGRTLDNGLAVLPRSSSRRDFRHEDLIILRRALRRAKGLHELSTLLGKPSISDRFETKAPGPEPAKDGYHCARRVRVELKQRAGALNDLPGLLAERFSVPILATHLATTSLLAATVRSSTVRAAAIVLNLMADGGPTPGTYQAWLVDRVSICHELCHILFDEPRGDGCDVVLDDPPRPGQEKAPIEQRAGAFAAELLMPLHGLRDLLGAEGLELESTSRALEIIDLVRTTFWTPAEIAVNHLYNHGYIARVPSFREELINGAKHREVSRPESLESAAERSHATVVRRAHEAYEAGFITDGAARALLELEADSSLPWEFSEP